MIRLVVAIAALVGFSDVGQAQLLNGGVEQATKILPELAGKTSIHFQERYFYFTGGDEFAVFQLGDGGTLKLGFPSELKWSLKALREPALPIVIVVKRNDKEQSFEIVRNSPLEKRLVELLEADLVENKHSSDDTKIIARVRDRLRNRELAPEEKKGVEMMLGFYRDPSTAPPESREFFEAWRKALSSDSKESSTDPNSIGEPPSPVH